jgi:geranylgeranyl diphosphate synthase type II
MYHRSKTGALFAGAAAAGAAAAGADPERWRPLGAKLGEAYQVADDIGDAVAENEAEMGKPIRQDTALGRPNAVRELGLEGALKRLRSLAEEAIAAIPDCPGAGELEAIIRGESKRLVPRSLAVYAA